MRGRRRANRRLSASQPSASTGSGLFSRIRRLKKWLVEQRFHYAAVLFVIAWFLLWYRAFNIQVILGPVYKEMADRQHTYTETIEGVRGSILDRNGLVLARSVPCQSVSANPRLMHDIDEAARKLAPLLKKKPETLAASFRKNRSFIWLARKVDDATASAIRKAAIPGITLEREFERVYPYRHLAGQLLGFVGIDNHGLEGVELAYDKILCGSSVKSLMSRNTAERMLKDHPTAEDQSGEDISLTIDVHIQFIAEEVLSEAVEKFGAKWGGVMMADVESGEILAWAQYPFFNPNNFRSSNFDLYRNRLAGDSMEPGSTFKPFLMAAALEEKAVSSSSKIFCENGTWRTKYVTIRDDTHSFGVLSASEIIAHSSNIGVAKIGLKLGAPTFHSYLEKLGFGHRTGVGIHESRGILRQPKDWSEVDLMSTSFGQSVSVTGVQMLQAYTILADGGEFRPLRLVMDKEGTRTGSHSGQRIFSPKTTKAVIEMMEQAVEGDGTGSKARIAGLRVAGKTGTAQKAERGVKGYSHKRLASFGGIVPSHAPRYVIYVMIDEPTVTGYGGTVAAPVFQQVAARTLAYTGYLPDTHTEIKKQPKKLTPAQLAQKKKDEIYLANLAKYRAAQAEKSRQEQRKALEDYGPGEMPDLMGLSLRRTLEICVQRGIIPTVLGSGPVIVKQTPSPGEPVTKGGTCSLWLGEEAAPPTSSKE